MGSVTNGINNAEYENKQGRDNKQNSSYILKPKKGN